MTFRNTIGVEALNNVQAFLKNLKDGPTGVAEYVRSGMIYYKEIPFLYRVFKPTTVRTKSKKEEGGYVVVSAILFLLSIKHDPQPITRLAKAYSGTRQF